jgi:hypothetical protein
VHNHFFARLPRSPNPKTTAADRITHDGSPRSQPYCDENEAGFPPHGQGQPDLPISNAYAEMVSWEDNSQQSWQAALHLTTRPARQALYHSNTLLLPS